MPKTEERQRESRVWITKRCGPQPGPKQLGHIVCPTGAVTILDNTVMDAIRVPDNDLVMLLDGRRIWATVAIVSEVYDKADSAEVVSLEEQVRPAFNPVQG